MHSTSRFNRIDAGRSLCVALVFGLAWWPEAVAAVPGSGTATIAPATDVTAGSVGTWTITYSAVESFTNGRLRVVIPAGWTAPQNADPAMPGYVTIDSDHANSVPSPPTIAGRVIDIDVSDLPPPKRIFITYGDDATSSGGRATAQEAAQVDVVFQVESDPGGAVPVPIAVHPSVDVVSAAAAAIAISPRDTTVTAGDFLGFTVRVEDAFGNSTATPVERTLLLSAPTGQFFLPADHGTRVTRLTIPAGNDSALVDFRSTQANGGLPQLVIVLSDDGLVPTLFATTDVTVSPAGISATVSSIRASTPVVADGVSTSIVTVEVRDGFGNPIAGVPVDIEASGSAVETDPVSPTGADGSVQGSVVDDVAETVTVTGTAGAVPIAVGTEVVFQAGGVHPTTSTVEVSPDTVEANNIDVSTISVTARDGQGNPVSGASVTLSVTPSGSGETLTQPGGVTDALGRAQGTLSGPLTGSLVVRATIDGVGVADSAVVTFMPGPAAKFVWTVPAAGVAGNYVDVTLRVEDARGNIVSTYADTVALLTSGTNGADWAVGPGAQGVLEPVLPGSWRYRFSPGDAGEVGLRVRHTRAEGVVLTADDTSAVGTSSTIAIDHAVASQMWILQGSGQTVPVNTIVPVDLRVRVADAYGNWVDGEPVTFGVVSGGGQVDVFPGAPIETIAIADGTGVARCQVWQLGTASGLNEASASVAAGSAVVTFSATAVPGPGVNLVIDPSSKFITTDATEDLTLTLTDAFGNAVPSKTVNVLIKDAVADGALGPRAGFPTTAINPTSRFGTTDGSGRIGVTYTAPSTAARSDTLEAFGDAATPADVTDAVFTTVTSGATNLRIVSLPGSAPAGQSFSFTVEAVDGYGNRDASDGSVIEVTGVTGSGLEFSATDSGPVDSVFTLGAGAVTVYGRGETVGIWDIVVRDTTSFLGADAQPVAIADAGIVDRYFVATVNSVQAGASFNTHIEARDAFGNLVTAFTGPVSLVAVDAGDSTVVLGDTLIVGAATVSGGVADVGEAYFDASTIRIRVRDVNARQGFSGPLQVQPASAYRVVELGGDSTGVEVDTDVALEARVVDLYDNPVANETVSFFTSAGGSVSDPSVVSAADGRVATMLTTATTVGTNRVVAQIHDGDPPGIETVEFVVETRAAALDHYEVLTSSTAITAGEIFGVDVRGRDVHGNVVTQDNSTVVSMSSDGSVQYAQSSGTLNAGRFSTTAWDSTAETVRVRASTGGIGGEGAPIVVAPASAYRVIAVSGGGSVTVGGVRTLTVSVIDRYGNAVGGQPVSFAILSSPVGAFLSDGVENLTNLIVSTDGVGEARVDLHTSGITGDHTVRATILDGTPASLEATTFTVSTTPGGIASFRVTPDAGVYTAGDTIRFVVQALDAQQNVIVSDNTTVVTFSLESGNGAVFLRSTDVLQNGVVTDSVIVTPAPQSIRLRVDDAGTAFGVSDPIVIQPGPPAGNIPMVASPDTITADGASTSTVNAGPVRDAFGNVVAQGTFVTVATTHGTIPSTDQDPGTPGSNEQRTDVSGVARFTLLSASAPGTASVTALAGAASGALDVVVAPEPSVVCVDPPNPAVVTPGENVAFSVVVEDTTTNGVTLSTATVFRFSDGVNLYSAALASPVWLPPATPTLLTFQAATVPPAMTVTAYQPVVALAGVDAYGASFSQTCLLPPNSLVVAVIAIEAVSAPAVVIRGDTVQVKVRVRNGSAATAVIDNVTLTIPAGDYGSMVPFGLPVDILAGEVKELTVRVDILASSPTVASTVDAAVFGTVAGNPVSDNSLAPQPLPVWVIVEGANPVYVVGSLAPATVSQNQTHAFSVDIRNDGQATLTLDNRTTLSFTDGTDTLSSALVQTTAIADGAVQTLQFQSDAIPAGMQGTFPVFLHLEGTEAGVPYQTDIDTSAQGDRVTVVTPAAVTYRQGSIAPTSINTNRLVAFEIIVSNAGGATIELDAVATRLDIPSAAFETGLDSGGQTHVAPQAETTLRFLAQIVGTAGAYVPSVRLVGKENGLDFFRDIALTDTVYVTDPATVRIDSVTALQSSITADQIASFEVVVHATNDGGASARLDTTEIRFVLGGDDRSAEFVVTAPASFENSRGRILAGGASDSLRFVVSDNPANRMSVGLFTVDATLDVTDEVDSRLVHVESDVSSNGRIEVQAPSRMTVDNVSSRVGVETRVVPRGTSDVAMFAIEFVNPDPTADAARIDALEVTVRDGAGRTLASPSIVINELYVQKDGGRVDAADLSVNPVVLPLASLGPEAELAAQESATLLFAVTVSPTAPVDQLVLSIDSESHIRVRNVASDELIPVVDAQTLQSFAGRLQSAPLVLLDRDFAGYVHNYPNPFRAGTEETRVAYFLERATNVSIRIFSLAGRLVYERQLGPSEPGAAAGPQELTWDGRNMNGELVRNGIYVCRVEAGGQTATFKIAVGK